jgi:hypothetical protein
VSSTKEVFVFFQEYVKPLYCEIEAKNNTLPVELLFEIHASFDHLKRFYVGEEEEAISCSKAISHLKRGALDAFKLKLKYFHNDFEKLSNSNIDLSLLDNGQFWPRLLADKEAIITLAKSARLSESNPDPAKAFEIWSEASIKMDEFYGCYLNQEGKLTWAKKKTFAWLNKDTCKGALIGFITGCLSSLLVWYFTKP